MDLIQALRREGVRHVSTSTLDRAMYASDASLHRVVPTAVAMPRDREELLLAVAVGGAHGPVTMRGAGTSIAGNAVGPGLVIDTRHVNRIVALDPERREAVVEPGVVHAQLQRAAAAHGLRFGPDPSTHSRCTIAGMIGNNACGSRALGYGRTSDNVEALTAYFATGEHLRLGPGQPLTGAPARVVELVEQNLAHVRTHFGRFSRQISGYALEQLLPENGRRVDRFLVGSEGTLAAVLDATVRLVPEPAATSLVVLGYPSMAEAADAVPGLLAAAPMTACEGLDSRITALVAGAPELPRGDGWLLVEVTGDSLAETQARAGRIVAAADALDSRVVADPHEAAALWRIREDGAGLASVALDRPAYSGWEDAAVPPAHLGAWLRDFEDLLTEHGLRTIPYGHFGEGCVHARIDFDLGREGALREFMIAAATRLRAYGGSLSGEHGDGRARSELLPLMYEPRSLDLFAQVKNICDPHDRLNPGVLVDPAPLDDSLRTVPDGADRGRSQLALVHDHGSLAEAVHRCSGVGRCVAPRPGGVMCPSFVATGAEQDSTRGRARVLQEAMSGGLVHGLREPAVVDALDLCLACKACGSECPTGVDMATYKTEVLARQYDGRRRPVSHYTLGRLPQWVRLAPRARGRSWFAKALTSGPGAWLAKVTAGVDRRRSLPALAARTLRASSTAPEDGSLPDVWVWADTFTDHFRPSAGLAALDYLDAVGVRVQVIGADACCGLTWFTTGQVEQARHHMAALVTALRPFADRPILALEPSCLAAVRGDLPELVDTEDGRQVAAAMVTLAELIERLRLPVPDLAGMQVVAQPHCHQQAVVGWQADQRVLERGGADVVRLSSCCGLAGNFGMERGHYDLSVAVAGSQLLPALRTHPEAVVLADGLSCRHQVSDLTGRATKHLAELLADRLSE